MFGPTEVGIALLLIIGVPLLVFVTSIWVFIDAMNIGVKSGQLSGLAGMGPGGWLFSCLLLWIVAFPYYLSRREDFKRINQQARPSATPPTSPTTQADDFEEQIRKLARLKQDEVITEDEFNQKKKALLGI